jgi:L-galactono-1,4-lactone dehydrogenase
VDEQVVSMRLVTPGIGALTLSKSQEPELFNLARVGLGAFGVVTQVGVDFG